MADDHEQGGIQRLSTRFSMPPTDATSSRIPASGNQFRSEPKAPNSPTSLSRKSVPQNVRSLKAFYDGVSDSDKILTVVGGGTAALTYLATADIEPKYTHVVVLGGQGYWGDQVAHRLAQPNHIFALPNQESAPFIDPAKHDRSEGILPHQDNSAYVHSKSYQDRLVQLESAVLARLQNEGRKVHFEQDVTIESIVKNELSYGFKANLSKDYFFADKVVVATGAAPSRSIPKELMLNDIPSAHAKILSYSDILTESIAEKIRGKDVFIYGGGATAAWAMEVSNKIGKSSVWVARNGFDNAEQAGPRVEAIIDGTRASQAKGVIKSINIVSSAPDPQNENKIQVTVEQKNRDGLSEEKSFCVDYVVNCIGQDAYEKGGLHDVLSSTVKDDIVPILDKNQVSGRPDTVLAFGTRDGGLEIIGAAAASYYDTARNLKPGRSVSEHLPRSGRVPITIGGVVSSVSALTNYMPLSQDSISGDISITGLNVNVMNKQQLAVYFTGRYQTAAASDVNAAVEDLLAKRSKTEFGLPDEELRKFEVSHFGHTSRQRSADLTAAAHQVDRTTDADRSIDRDRDRHRLSGR